MRKWIWILSCSLVCSPLLGFTWHTTHYYWSLGMALDADVCLMPTTFYKARAHIARKELSKIFPGAIVWIHGSDFDQFLERYFPQIEHPFILVMTGFFGPFPSYYKDPNHIESFLNSPKLIHLFCQNNEFMNRHPKVTSLPLGMDFHTLEARPEVWEMPHQSVDEQEESLANVIAKALPPKERIPRIIIDFHNAKLNWRQEATKKLLATGLTDTSGERIPRDDLWELKTKYAFSASAHGVGLDSHRTWEDLMLGCIVIVKASPLDCLYKDLPVVIVKDWSDITEEKLLQWLEDYSDTLSNPRYREQLTHDYWHSLIREKQGDYLVDLELQESGKPQETLSRKPESPWHFY